MYEIKGEQMDTLKSLSLFIGTGQCNAYCSHCAGVPLRKYAPKEDGIIDHDLIHRTIKLCYERGARYLSLSSSGEPTLSPLSTTKALKLIHGCEKEGIKFSPINLYSNGIKIGEDKSFCEKYLPLWKSYGLTTVYITVHNIDEEKNAKIYGIKSYPPLKQVLSRIDEGDLLTRANIVLSKRNIGNFEGFVSILNHLMDMGVDYISAWPIRDLDDKLDLELSPLETELDKIEDWIEKNYGLTDRIRLLREKSKVAYQRGQKLTLFPDGTLSNSWCNT